MIHGLLLVKIDTRRGQPIGILYVGMRDSTLLSEGRVDRASAQVLEGESMHTWPSRYACLKQFKSLRAL